MKKSQVILGVPGNWKNRTELLQAVSSKNAGYLMAGFVLLNTKKDIDFQVEVSEHDPSLKEAFYDSEIVDKNLINKIEQHTFIVNLIADVNGLEGIKEAIDACSALLNAGGLAVKVETAGLIYSKEEWFQLFRNQEPFPIYSHFVILTEEEELYFSCGMKAFGLPDVAIPSSIPAEEAAELLNNFNLYNIIEEPNFKDGEIFDFELTSQSFVVKQIEDVRYTEDDVFFNPFGLLNLIPV
ncbi:DUF4261 domain-containing protein [Planococcus halotolerans]|uniref:Endopeptidase n=1 Tax=Planococcus halotolerans TaxID=2233542 RepID=A0A365KK03_9BACL|nr:DUF4261 domain-containing protein [Planococcus halotolerans]RAZ73472.1 endopeptidase [Planococcus halotolerans]